MTYSVDERMFDNTVWTLNENGFPVDAMVEPADVNPTHKALMRPWGDIWWVRCDGDSTTVKTYLDAARWATGCLEPRETLLLRVGPAIPKDQAP